MDMIKVLKFIKYIFNRKIYNDIDNYYLIKKENEFKYYNNDDYILYYFNNNLIVSNINNFDFNNNDFINNDFINVSLIVRRHNNIVDSLLGKKIDKSNFSNIELLHYIYSNQDYIFYNDEIDIKLKYNNIYINGFILNFINDKYLLIKLNKFIYELNQSKFFYNDFLINNNYLLDIITNEYYFSNVNNIKLNKKELKNLILLDIENVENLYIENINHNILKKSQLEYEYK